MISMIALSSPIGMLHLVARGDALASVSLPTSSPPDHPVRETPVLARTAAQLTEYFEGARTEFDVPLAADGTEFQQRVWALLATIPFGMTWSYGELARALGSPTASRAVGAANGKNPIAIIVPCHRVIGANGSLTGYAGGMATKQQLLAHERRIAEARGVRPQLALPIAPGA